jgi:PAS domain-containing protein
VRDGEVGIFQDLSCILRIREVFMSIKSEYQNLFKNMQNGFAYHKVVFDENNKPVDYIFLEVNSSFETFTGLKEKDIIGKRVTEMIPDIRHSETDLISIYGNVALTGEAVKLELYFEPFRKWYSVNAYCPEKGYFVALFDDITEKIEMQINLKKKVKDLQEFYDMAVNREVKMKELKEEVAKLTSELAKFKK